MQRAATIRHRTSLFEEATVDRRGRVRLRSQPRRHRPPRGLQPAPAPARLRRDRQHDLPRAPDRGAHGARRRHARAAAALTVREVAHRVGYRQPAQFAKAFRRHHGASPSAYRSRRRFEALRRRPRIAAAARLSRRRRRRAHAWRTYRVALCRGRPIGCRGACRRRARRARERKRTVQQMVVVGVIAVRDRHRHRPEHPLVPACRLDAGRQDRHALGRPRSSPRSRSSCSSRWSCCFSVLEFRMRPGEENLDGPPIHGNTRLEVIWTAIPAILIVGLVHLRLRRHARHREGAGGRQRARRRPSPASSSPGPSPTTRAARSSRTAQLYLPAGKSVKFDVRSKDVIHDFWVPDFRMKIDAVPGHHDALPRHAEEPAAIGDHAIVCAELCGLGHAFMRQTAHVLAPRDFDKWVQKMTARPAAAGGGGGGGGRRRGRQGSSSRSGNADTGATACGTLPHAGRRGRHGPGRPRPRQGPQGQGRGLHQAVDPRAPTR